MLPVNKNILTLVLASLISSAQGQRPNVIIMQPDDFPFMDEWTAPPNNPNNPAFHDVIDNGGQGLKNINSLRLNGLQMMQAYTASPVCGTSRYSTITGRMPSRAASVRDRADTDTDDPPLITIPTTKLLDVNGQNDCSEENLAKAFQSAEDPYRTGMFGKWHLSEFTEASYTYERAVEVVQGCGFDTVGGLYIENLNGFFTETNGRDKPFGHNMEFMTFEAIRFINETIDDGENFFMYFNPTVPHSSDDVIAAIEEDNCELDIPDPNYSWNDERLWIKGMVEGSEEDDDRCRTYRETIQERAVNDDDQGKIWVDDAVGALLQAMDDKGVLNNTIFLFQEDHGMDTKGGLYEGGLRIPQFVHYPDGIAPNSQFYGLVSTVDIAATMLDFAGIPAPYDMDGKSWKDALGNPEAEAEWKDNRCLFFEVDRDRAVRCGCYKWLDIFDDTSKTYTQGRDPGWGLSNSLDGNLFDLCGGTENYITDQNMEETVVQNPTERGKLVDALDCHVDNTDPDASPVYSTCPAVDPYVCRDSPLEAIFRGTNRDCDWIARRASRCQNQRWYSHCQAKCGQCGQCQDSRQIFAYNGQEYRCARDVDVTLCEIPTIAQTCPATCGICWV